MSIGEAIKQGRIAKDMTQDELAKELGLTRQAVQRYEKDKTKNIAVELRLAIADILNLPLEKLLTSEEYQLYLNNYRVSEEDYTIWLHKSKLPKDFFAILFKLEEGENPDNFIIHHKSEFSKEGFEQLKKFIQIMKIQPPDENTSSGRSPRKITYTEDFSELFNSDKDKE